MGLLFPHFEIRLQSIFKTSITTFFPLISDYNVRMVLRPPFKSDAAEKTAIVLRKI